MLVCECQKQGARLRPACNEAQISIRTFQRWQMQGTHSHDRRPCAKRPPPANKLAEEERAAILNVCHQKEFASLPPSQIVPKLADDGLYLASESSYYRVLRAAQEQHYRGRASAPRAKRELQEHIATKPNMVWSWDITWLAGPIVGLYYRFYVIIDIFSRKIVGWEVHESETGELAAQLVQKAVLAEGCINQPLILHSDNGSAQKSYTLLAKLESLGIEPSYSRPRVSNDNAFSESVFRTCKYRPEYPLQGFATLTAARKWCLAFVRWYNNHHRHSALKFVTPTQRHAQLDRIILEKRHVVYTLAKQAHPERWANKTRNWNPVGAVPLNRKQKADVGFGEEKIV